MDIAFVATFYDNNDHTKSKTPSSNPFQAAVKGKSDMKVILH